MSIAHIKESKINPGSYLCKCASCGEQFWSDKRNVICDDCRGDPPKVGPEVVKVGTPLWNELSKD